MNNFERKLKDLENLWETEFGDSPEEFEIFGASILKTNTLMSNYFKDIKNLLAEYFEKMKLISLYTLRQSVLGATYCYLELLDTYKINQKDIFKFRNLNSSEMIEIGINHISNVEKFKKISEMIILLNKEVNTDSYFFFILLKYLEEIEF